MKREEALRILGIKEISYGDSGEVMIDGATYDDLVTAVNIELLDGCGCGDPDLNIAYVRDALSLLVLRMNGGHMDDWRSKEEAYFKTEAAAQFFWYWASHKGFADHGSGIPGWVTEKGKAFIVLFTF